MINFILFSDYMEKYFSNFLKNVCAKFYEIIAFTLFISNFLDSESINLTINALLPVTKKHVGTLTLPNCYSFTRFIQKYLRLCDFFLPCYLLPFWKY